MLCSPNVYSVIFNGSPADTSDLALVYLRSFSSVSFTDFDINFDSRQHMLSKGPPYVSTAQNCILGLWICVTPCGKLFFIIEANILKIANSRCQNMCSTVSINILDLYTDVRAF